MAVVENGAFYASSEESMTVHVVLNYVRIEPFGMGYGFAGDAAGVLMRYKLPADWILALGCTTVIPAPDGTVYLVDINGNR